MRKVNNVFFLPVTAKRQGRGYGGSMAGGVRASPWEPLHISCCTCITRHYCKPLSNLFGCPAVGQTGRQPERTNTQIHTLTHKHRHINTFTHTHHTEHTNTHTHALSLDRRQTRTMSGSRHNACHMRRRIHACHMWSGSGHNGIQSIGSAI